MVEQPPQGFHVTVAPVHFRQALSHGVKSLCPASVPGDRPFDPVCFFKHAVGTGLAVAFADSSTHNGGFTGGIDDEFAPFTGCAVVLKNHIIADGQILTRQKF